jgi:hypothetical protein
MCGEANALLFLALGDGGQWATRVARLPVAADVVGGTLMWAWPVTRTPQRLGYLEMPVSGHCPAGMIERVEGAVGERADDPR